jgi:hypothetical protein
MATIVPNSLIIEHHRQMIELIEAGKRRILADKDKMREVDLVRILAYFDRKLRLERATLAEFAGPGPETCKPPASF